MTDARRNVELKATDPDPERTLARALGLPGVADHGVLRQRDTYFSVPRGRLKLREETPGAAHLIAYLRPDEAAVRVSEYRLAPVPDVAALREALAVSLGIHVVVEKARRLLLFDGVRIHLDTVAGLGSYVELEAVAPPGSDLSAERAKVARLRAELEIDDLALREGSYADALLAVP
jgi:adenylate cyclase, class 2